MSKQNTTRLEALDGIRILAALVVFMYHTYWNMNCSYGPLNGLISQGSIFMTLFFMLSGFLLYFVYIDSDFSNFKTIKHFLYKRILSIYPMFLIVYIVFLFEHSQYTFLQNILAMPTQVTLLFNAVPGFLYLTNSGTWFISSIFICYILFPYMQQCTKNFKLSSVLVMLIALYIIESITRWYPRYLDVPNYFYTNNALRLLEFFMGILLAKVYLHYQSNNIFPRLGRWLFWSMLILIVGIVSIRTYRTNSLAEVRSDWQMITIPLFSMLLLASAFYQGTSCKLIFNNRLVKYCSLLSYQFWIATFFTTPIVVKNFGVSVSNVIRIFAAFGINILITFLLYGAQKLIEKFFNKCNYKQKSFGAFLLAIVIPFFIIYTLKLIREIPKTHYDFENSQVSIDKNVNGVYEDEGTFAWLSPKSRFTIKATNNTLKVKLKTNATALQVDNQHTKTLTYILMIFWLILCH